eukprot:6008793-Prymnesium_polylepis.2
MGPKGVQGPKGVRYWYDDPLDDPSQQPAQPSTPSAARTRSERPMLSEPTKPLNRWTSVVAGMYIEICGGSVYITSLYLTTVKDLWFPGQGNADFLMQQLVFACNVRIASKRAERARTAHAAHTRLARTAQLEPSVRRASSATGCPSRASSSTAASAGRATPYSSARCSRSSATAACGSAPPTRSSARLGCCGSSGSCGATARATLTRR